MYLSLKVNGNIGWTASILFEGVGAINHNFWEILKALLHLIVEKLQILEKKGGKDFKQLRFSNSYNVY